MLKKVIIGISAIVLLAVGGILTLTYTSTPESTYLGIQRAAAEDDWERVYRTLSSDTRTELSAFMPHVVAHAGEVGIPTDKVPDTRTMFVRVVSTRPKLQELFVVKDPKIVSSHERADGVVLSVINTKTNTPRRVKMVREGIFWLMHVELR